MEFKENQVVKLRNGIVGVTASFNSEPFQLVFASFTTPTRRYDENLKNKNENYDVVEVYDGSGMEDVKDAFKKSFKVEDLPIVWKEKVNG